MIWPFLILVGMGKFLWFPIPVFLLWPFMIAFLVLTAPLSVFSKETSVGMFTRTVWRVSGLFAAMNGTRVWVDPVDGPRIRVIVI